MRVILILLLLTQPAFGRGNHSHGGHHARNYHASHGKW